MTRLKEKIGPENALLDMLNALVFISQTVFGKEIGEIGDFVRAKNQQRIPVVMSKNETKRSFDCLKGEKVSQCGAGGGRDAYQIGPSPK